MVELLKADRKTVTPNVPASLPKLAILGNSFNLDCNEFSFDCPEVSLVQSIFPVVFVVSLLHNGHPSNATVKNCPPSKVPRLPVCEFVTA